MRWPRGRRVGWPAYGALLMAMATAAGEEWPMAPLIREGPAAPVEDAAATPPLMPPVGEEQVLVVRWGLLPVGEVHMWTEWARDEGGQRWLALRARVRSNRVLSAVFSMDGFFESLMTSEGFESWRATWSCIERRHVFAEWLSFDRTAGVVRRAVAGGGALADVPLDGELRDLGAAVWWFRSELARGGPPLRLCVAVGRDLVQIRTTPRGEEWLTLAGRTVRALRFEPEVWRDGQRIERNRYLIWFGAGPPHPLLRIQVTSPYATLVATATEPPSDKVTAR